MAWSASIEIVKEVLKHVNFDLKDLHVVIGPSSSSYEINDDIKNKFETLPIDSANYIETRGRDRHGIDLKKANAALLIIMVFLKKIFIRQRMLHLNI